MSPRQLLALVWCALRAPVSSPFTPPRATAAAASRRAPRAASAPSDAELKVELTIDRWDGTEPWPSPPASRDDAGTPAALAGLLTRRLRGAATSASGALQRPATDTWARQRYGPTVEMTFEWSDGVTDRGPDNKGANSYPDLEGAWRVYAARLQV